MRMNRRAFSQTVMLGVAGAAVPGWAQARLNLKIGHTGITWPMPSASGARGAQPPVAGTAARGADPGLAPAPVQRPVDPAAIEQVVKDISGIGYHGVELFGWQVDGMEARGGIGQLLEKYRLPLISTYGGPNLTDPAQRKASIERTVATARLVKKYGGKVIVFGPNSVPRDTYKFADHKANIIAALNDGAKAIRDVGLTPVLHQHTGTCIESRDETYAVMEAVDTRELKFGPDIGQLQKGGVDPVQVVKDFLPLIQHLHLKDYAGGDAFLGYAPLGRGRVNLDAILQMMNGRNLDGMVMVELDSGANMPMTALEAATIAKTYLERQGVSFRS
jgi:inosose dehydratase